jgi:predicted O-linked N-acetylglucosamine transferase (SPINDLY family)
MRGRFTGAFDHFVDIDKMPHRQAAELIHENGIDVLIDLMGYTRYCRPTILAHRPAPIQVNYLGYPGTMAADFIDYIIVDPFLVPTDQQPFYTERLVHLPDCYQPSDTRRQMANPAPSRASCGLPEKGFVFCCFNNSYKLTPAFFDIWMRLLNAVPGSVLWLSERNDFVKDNLRREASCRGVAAERLVFLPRAPMPEYLARLGLADLFLDTLPYNAGATANDALWTGLPVLTCAGETYVGRMAGAVLTAAGLPELITTSVEAYETLAFQLATEPGRLTAVRQKLERNRSTMPLFDTERFNRKLEAAYQRMWETWRAGEAPAAFSIRS